MRAQLDGAIAHAVDVSCGKRMEWGIDDCALWSANILRPVLGYDPAASFRGRYQDQAGAKIVLGPLGLAMTLARVARRHGWKRIEPDAAQTGDVGVVMTIFGPACVLSWRAQHWVGPVDYGFSTVPREMARFCWSIG